MANRPFDIKNPPIQVNHTLSGFAENFGAACGVAALFRETATYREIFQPHPGLASAFRSIHASQFADLGASALTLASRSTELQSLASQFFTKYPHPEILSEFVPLHAKLISKLSIFSPSNIPIAESEFIRQQAALKSKFHDMLFASDAYEKIISRFKESAKNWKQLPRRVKRNLLALATTGWYLDAEMSIREILNFCDDIESRSPEEMEQSLTNYFRDALERIESTLRQRHPGRAALLAEAFKAHHGGLYSLSIPALFAQADGICLDLTGCQIFQNGGPNRFVKKIDANTLEHAYLQPLIQAIPIKESSKQRRDTSLQLNRHAVMHGESTDFATEKNGLKAISFVNYVSYAIAMASDLVNESLNTSEEQVESI